jgi:hypothetical protein
MCGPRANSVQSQRAVAALKNESNQLVERTRTQLWMSAGWTQRKIASNGDHPFDGDVGHRMGNVREA